MIALALVYVAYAFDVCACGMNRHVIAASCTAVHAPCWQVFESDASLDMPPLGPFFYMHSLEMVATSECQFWLRGPYLLIGGRGSRSKETTVLNR